MGSLLTEEKIMFIELERTVVPFSVGEAEFYLRFDNRALLEIEKAGYDIFQFDAAHLTARSAKCFLKNGLRCWYEEYREHDLDGELEEVAGKVLRLCGAEQVSGLIAAGMLQALPESVIGAKPPKDSDSGADFSRLFGFWCDIMGKPEELFWELTLREVLQRWDAYAIFMGYKQAPVEVRKYDD